MKRCVFFDRDGIVNASPGAGYVTRPEDFHLLIDFVEVLRLVRSQGYEAIVVSNQRGVARGLMTCETVDRIHANLRARLHDSHGVDLTDIYYCPHDEGQCDCRKPQPGLLVRAAQVHGIDLGQSWMVGDQERDIEAGLRAGCRTVLVSEDAGQTRAHYTVRDLRGLRHLLGDLLGPELPLDKVRRLV